MAVLKNSSVVSSKSLDDPVRKLRLQLINDLNTPLLAYTSSLNPPYNVQENSQFEDLSNLSDEEQEARTLRSIICFSKGLCSAEIRVVGDSSSHISLSFNPSLPPRIRNYIEVCRRALLNLYSIYTRTYPVYSNPCAPVYSRSVVEVIMNYVTEVQSLMVSESSLVDVSYKLQKHQERLQMCADLAKIVVDKSACACDIMDAVVLMHRKAVVPEIVGLVVSIQAELQHLFLRSTIAWVTEGVCLADPSLEFMIWPLDRLKDAPINLKERKDENDSENIVFVEGHVALRSLCPRTWQSEFSQIVAAGKYIRLLLASGVQVQSCNHLVQGRLDGSVLCETSAKKLVSALCTNSSSQLLSHIHSVYNIENIFDSVNAIYLGTASNFNSLLLSMCEKELYKPIDEVSKKVLERRLQILLSHAVGNMAIVDDIRLEFSPITTFKMLGSTEEKYLPGKPLVLTALALVWSPSFILSQIWTTEERYYYELIQRLLFTIHAMYYKLEDRIMELSRDHCQNIESRITMGQLAEMHSFMMHLTSSFQQAIDAEVETCRAELLEACSVEQMCEALRSRLILPITKHLFLQNGDAITNIERICDSIHNYLDLPEDATLAYNAFTEARTCVLMHMTNSGFQEA